MPTRPKEPPAKAPILKAALIFVFGFILSGILWSQVSNSYCHVITVAASKTVAWMKDATLEQVVRKGDGFSVAMSFQRAQRRYLLGVTLLSGVSRYYAFTIPLTISLVAALSLFIRRKKRAFAEALLILLASHFLYVLFVESTMLTEQAMLNRIEPVSEGWLSFYQYLWKALEFTVMSFGPFLIALYTYVRFRR
jgi:hypothetical protein